MGKKGLISKDIEQFYNKSSEETRLEQGMGIFEFERIKSLIEQYLPPTKATILDVGGGTGKYSEWLAQKGHHVHLIEPVEKHIRTAQKRAKKHKFSVHLGEARNLDFEDKSVDIVILHGPLYHLQKREDRAKAIQEARRVLKDGGIILGFAINHSASTLVGLLNGMIHIDSFFNMCKDELTTGVHTPPKDFPGLLAEAYYHKPDQLKEEFLSENLQYINTYAVEGMCWLDKDYFANMLDKQKRKTLAKLLKVTENDSSLLALSPHMMIAVKK